MSLLIGSVALSLYGLNREPNDLDIIIRHTDLEECIKFFLPKKVKVHNDSHVSLHKCKKSSFPVVELELAWPGSTAEEILNEIPIAPLSIGYWTWPSVDTLYWLKMSHRFKKNSIHFEKTRDDILWIRKELHPHIKEAPGWYKRRETETLAHNHPNLQPGQTKEAFFNGDGVRYYYNHDWVHTVVARICGNSDGIPAYSFYLKEGEAVACDKEKFMALPETTKLRGVIEEAMVLALERSQIPRKLDAQFNKDVSPEWSYKYALQKVCTSITSGWFREYAWDNYHLVLEQYPKDYVEQFWYWVVDSKMEVERI